MEFYNTLKRCGKIYQLIDGECAEIKPGMDGDILEEYSRLLEIEKDCVEQIRSDIINALGN